MSILSDEFVAMAKGMKNVDGTARFTNVRQGPAVVKQHSTSASPVKRAMLPVQATGPADWYNQSSGGKRYTGD